MAKPRTTPSLVKSSRSAAKATSIKRSEASSVARQAKSGNTPTKPETPVPLMEVLDASDNEPTKKSKKEKVMRDSFTMPAADYDKIAALKKKCLAMGISVKKSELLRAGLGVLECLSTKDLAQAVGTVESIKTGRPAGDKKKTKGDKG